MTRIAIVGAGCAGLGAVTALIPYDVEIILIEASDRLGGRAWTSSAFADLPIDMGPQFVQDPDVNPWKGIMDALGILGIAPATDTRYRIREGDTWRDEETLKAIRTTDELIDDGFEAACSQYNKPPLDKRPSAEGDAIQYQRLALGSNGYGSIAESAEPWQYIASDAARQAHPSAGENIYVVGGIGNLVSTYADKLIKGLGKRLSCIPKTQITAIESTSDGVFLSADGKAKIWADYCILTVPVSQVAPIAFTPPLSDQRRVALGLVRLGSYKKVAFRPKKIPDALEANIEYYIYDSLTESCWQYFRLPTDPTILICVTSGDSALRFDKQDGKIIFGITKAFLSQAYADDGDFTPEGDYVVTNWSNQPFVMGAYSYTAYDKEKYPAADDPIPFHARVEIARPHERIHFAGEATWTEGYGTIAGAYRSGERAVKEIIARIGIPLL